LLFIRFISPIERAGISDPIGPTRLRERCEGFSINTRKRQYACNLLPGGTLLIVVRYPNSRRGDGSEYEVTGGDRAKDI
jgi:hypothetical protein